MSIFNFGLSPLTLELERKIGHIARTRVPILIEGETGTGKETLARHIHSLTPDAGPFQRCVCASGGAPTVLDNAAVTSGWVFFKYVDRLDATAQEQLLAAIDRQSGSGAWERVVSSSSRPLDLLVAQDRFNAALYHHLAGVRLAVPRSEEPTSEL